MGPSLPPLPLPLLLVLVAFAGADRLPSSLKTCKQNDPDYNGCLKQAIQDAMPVLAEGIPKMRIPPIEPMHFTQIIIDGTSEQPVTLKLELKDVLVTGMGSSIIENIEMKPGSYHMKAKTRSESPFTLAGLYKADGRILVLPIQGQGNIRLTAPRLEGEMEMIGQPIERDGETYWDVTDFKVNIKNWKKLTINATGLFNNDKLLADNTLMFLNENSVEIANELKPALEEAVGTTFKDVARRLFDKVPYKFVFPPE